ncbi:hypothetical protein M0R45_019301 [Rubus argutus]|uniref:peptidylprolyl isomerase n=1 Tax=Rubus argutus TaxID=59490 RepID=A0AAW1X6M8_RUBAR
MQVGGQRLLIVPPELAYGSKGVQEIPPNATIEDLVSRKMIGLACGGGGWFDHRRCDLRELRRRGLGLAEWVDAIAARAGSWLGFAAHGNGKIDRRRVGEVVLARARLDADLNWVNAVIDLGLGKAWWQLGSDGDIGRVHGLNRGESGACGGGGWFDHRRCDLRELRRRGLGLAEWVDAIAARAGSWLGFAAHGNGKIDRRRVGEVVLARARLDADLNWVNAVIDLGLGKAWWQLGSDGDIGRVHGLNRGESGGW